MRPEYFIPIPVLAFVVFIPSLHRALRLKDKLYERLYTDHPAIWESLGRPIGWQWRPPEAWYSLSYMSTDFAWLSLTDPAWLAQAPELRDLFHQLRAGLRHWNFVAMPIFFGSGILFFLIIFLFFPESM